MLHRLPRPRLGLCLGAITALCLAFAASPHALAQTATWNGGGADGNWSTTANWSGTAPASSGSSTLVFSGTTNLTTNNDLTNFTASGTTSITFSAGSGSFVLGGNAITLNGNISDPATALQTIALGLILSSGTHNIGVASGGSLTLSGDLTGSGNIAITNTGTVTLSGTNSNYTGSTTVSAAGTLILASNNALGNTSGVSITNGSGVVDLSSTSANPITITGRNISIAGSGPDSLGEFRAIGGGVSTWAGTVAISTGTGNGGNRIGTVGANSTLVITGAITGTGDLSIRTDGATGGTVRLANTSGTANSWATTYAVVGTLQLGGADNQLPTGTILHLGNSANVSFATVDLGGVNQTVAGIVTDGTIMSQTITNTSATLSTLTVNSTADGVFGSNISSGNGSIQGNLALVKQGTATLTLQGTTANTFTGTTTVLGGTLVLNKAASGTTAISGNLVIGNGTAAATVRLGQSQQILDASTVTLNGTGANAGVFSLNGNNETVASIFSGTAGAGVIQNGGVANSTLTINIPLPAGSTTDVTDTYSGILQDGTGGGVLNLTVGKSGTGTGNAILALTSAETYSGVTTINSVLQISNGSALGTGGSTANGTVVSNGGRLELTGGITVANETLTLNGAGGNPDTSGALRSVGTAGDVDTWAGQIILASGNGGSTGTSTRVGARDGTTLVLSGQITDNGSGFDLAIRSDTNAQSTVVISGSNNSYRDTYLVLGLLRLQGGDNRLPTTTVLNMGNSANTGTSTLDLNGTSQQVAGLVDAGMSMTESITNLSTAVSTFTVNNTNNYTYGVSGRGAINGNINLVKSGTGVLVLGADNGYTGTTVVNAGILQVGNGGTVATRSTGDTGSNGAGNSLTVNSGGTIAGTGNIRGNAVVGSGATIAPGDVVTPTATDPTGIGVIAFTSNLDARGATIRLQLGGSSVNDASLPSTTDANYSSYVAGHTATYEASTTSSTGGNHDQLRVAGNITINSSSIVSVSLLGYTPVAGDVFDLIDWGTNMSFLVNDFSVGTNLRSGGTGGGQLDLPNLTGNLVWDVSDFASNGILIVANAPEPGRVMLMMLGLGAVMMRRRRK